MACQHGFMAQELFTSATLWVQVVLYTHTPVNVTKQWDTAHYTDQWYQWYQIRRHRTIYWQASGANPVDFVQYTTKLAKLWDHGQYTDHWGLRNKGTWYTLQSSEWCESGRLRLEYTPVNCTRQWDSCQYTDLSCTCTKQEHIFWCTDPWIVPHIEQ